MTEGRSRETRAAPAARVGVKRPRLKGGAGAARGCAPGGTSDRAAPSGGRHIHFADTESRWIDGGLWHKGEVHLRGPSPGGPDCTAARWRLCSPDSAISSQRSSFGDSEIAQYKGIERPA